MNADQIIGHFIRLCLIRALREDRTLLACNLFIKTQLSEEFIIPVNYPIHQIWEESKPTIPVLYILSAGADPSKSIEEFSK